MTPNLKLLLITCSSKVTMRREACRERVKHTAFIFLSFFTLYFIWAYNQLTML